MFVGQDLIGRVVSNEGGVDVMDSEAMSWLREAERRRDKGRYCVGSRHDNGVTSGGSALCHRAWLGLMAAWFALTFTACGGAQVVPPPTTANTKTSTEWASAVKAVATDLIEATENRTALRIAVLPFQDSRGGHCRAGAALAEDLAQELTREARALSDASALTVITSRTLTRAEIEDPWAAAVAGKLPGVTAVVSGTIGPAGSSYDARARLMLIEDGAVLGTGAAPIEIGAVSSRGGCGVQPPSRVSGTPNASNVYGRETGPHKAALYTSVAGLATGLLAGAITWVEMSIVADHCDNSGRCDRTGADAAKVGQTVARITDGGLAVGVLALGVYYLIPAASPATSGFRVAPPGGGIFGATFLWNGLQASGYG